VLPLDFLHGRGTLGYRRRMADRPYRFYASEISYFSGKVRPALRAKRVPYDEILPTTAAYREVIRPRTGLAMIPVVVTPEDETWQDSSDILDALEARFPEPAIVPATPVQRLVCYLVELYADEFLILPGLHYRWSFPESETRARQDFAIMTGDARRAGRFADQVKAFTGLTVDRSSSRHQATPRGTCSPPSSALRDRAVSAGAGVRRAPTALWELRPPVHGRCQRACSAARPATCHWIERMNHPDPDAFGPWFPGDTLSPAVRRLLELVGRDAVPLILDAARAFDAWADGATPGGDELPRGVGMHRTRLRGVEFERFTLSYSLWMVQRVQAAHRRSGERAHGVRGALGSF
jgi:glutathione S-transferase